MLAQLGEQGVAALHHALTTPGCRPTRRPPGPPCVVDVAGAADARVVLAAGSPRGNEVLAHVAARSGVAMAANVVASSGRSTRCVVTRQVVGGAALEQMRLGDDAGACCRWPATPCEPCPAEQPTQPEVRP